MTGMAKLFIFIYPFVCAHDILCAQSSEITFKRHQRSTRYPASSQGQLILHTRLGVGLDAPASQLLEFGDQSQKENQLKDGVSLL